MKHPVEMFNRITAFFFLLAIHCLIPALQLAAAKLVFLASL
jgi:hypothetical protein